MSVYAVTDQVPGTRGGMLAKPTVHPVSFPLESKVAGNQGLRVHLGHTGGMVSDSA